MLLQLLFGPARRGQFPTQAEIRPRELSIDVVLDALKIAQAILPKNDVTLFVFKWSGNRYVEPKDLPDLTTEERLGLCIRATEEGHPRDPKGTLIGDPIMQVALGGNTFVRSRGLNDSENRAAVAVVDVLEKHGRLLVQPRRLELLLLPAVFLIGVVGWLAALAQQLLALPGAIAGWAALILLGVLIARATIRRAAELDAAPVAHRFEPVSYRQQREDRASARRDLRIGSLAAIAGAVAGAVLTVLLPILLGR